MELIDKDAVVAEIKRRLSLLESGTGHPEVLKRVNGVKAYKSILSFLDTFEVKEVDLEKEYRNFVEDDAVYSKLVNNIVGKSIAKHFYKLGLNTRKEN